MIKNVMTFKDCSVLDIDKNSNVEVEMIDSVAMCLDYIDASSGHTCCVCLKPSKSRAISFRSLSASCCCMHNWSSQYLASCAKALQTMFSCSSGTVARDIQKQVRQTIKVQNSTFHLLITLFILSLSFLALVHLLLKCILINLQTQLQSMRCHQVQTASSVKPRHYISNKTH